MGGTNDGRFSRNVRRSDEVAVDRTNDGWFSRNVRRSDEVAVDGTNDGWFSRNVRRSDEVAVDGTSDAWFQTGPRLLPRKTQKSTVSAGSDGAQDPVRGIRLRMSPTSVQSAELAP